MKKILLILIIIGALFVTGCEKNRLICTNEENASNFEFTSKYVFTFNDDNVKLATMTSTGKLLDDLNTDTAIKEYSASAQSAADTYNKTEGIKATVNTSKNKVTLTVSIEPSKLTDDLKSDYGVDLNKKELKEEMEGLGYTCK